MAKLPEPRYSEEWEESQKNRFDAILGRPIATLVRESSTEYNFLEIKNKVESVIEQVQTLAEHFDYWAKLSDQRRNIINASLDQMVSQFSEMASFDPKQNNAWDQRNNLILNFNSIYNAFYDNLISPLDAYLGRAAYSQEVAGEFGQEARKELSEIRRIKKEIDKVEIAVKEASEISGSVVGTAYSGAFTEQAKEHKESANKWLVSISIAATIITLITLTVLYDIIKELADKTYKAGVEAYIFKLALIAVFYFGLRFLIRNYSAHQHLYIVNIQRANVLKSMEAFRTSATEDSTKDQILLAGVGAAYSQQETGFITTKEGAGSDDGDIVDIVKSVLKK